MSSINPLSTIQLNDLASQLSSEQDQLQYKKVISLSNNLQEKIQALRLERKKNYISKTNPSINEQKQLKSALMKKNNKIQPLSIQSSNLNHNKNIPIKPKPTCPLPPLPPSSSTPIQQQQKEKELEEDNDTYTVAMNSSPTSPLTPPTPLYSSSSTSTLVSLPSPIELQHKALPSFPETADDDDDDDFIKRNIKREKHDTIYDTTSYYYEKSKKSKVTFAEQLVTATLTRPSSTITSSSINLSIITNNNKHLPSPTYSKTVDASFLLMTPPASPNIHSPSPSNASSSFYNDNPLPLPPIMHVQKKVNGLRGLLTRTYQLNEIISSKTLISPFQLYNGMDTITREAKAVLRVIMTTKIDSKQEEHDKSFDQEMINLFGFTFCSNGKKKHSKPRRSSLGRHHPSHHHQYQQDAQCVVVSDHIVSDALSYWIDHQKDPLPALNHATHILRESVKLYVVYDKSWFY
ncbi:hypothetical protein BJ944DRAFT_249441 [Cunninghamella echinulata]|nr:hypothetical protein BJ944DRAFT_249441 [Cunninghamella echinulata]